MAYFVAHISIFPCMSNPDNDLTMTMDDVRHVTLAQQEEFRQSGHVLIRGLLSQEELAVYRPLVAEGVKRMRTEKRRLADRDTYGKAFLQIMNLWRVDEGIRRL